MIIYWKSFSLIVVSTVQSKVPTVSKTEYVNKSILVAEMYHNLKSLLMILAFEKIDTNVVSISVVTRKLKNIHLTPQL